MSMRFFLPAAMGLALFAAACTGSDSPEPTPTAPVAEATATAIPPSPTPPPPTATPVRPAASAFPEALQESSQRYLEEIAVLRNTPLKQNVDMFALSREQARLYYGGSSSTPSPDPAPTPRPPRLDPKQEVYEVLGLVPEEKPPVGGSQGQPSLQEAQLDNLISLITGFYSPELNALYVLETINGGLSGGLARSTIVHELTHALQYQHTDIDGIAAKRSNDWDGTTALLDVIEGEAVYTENQILGFSTRSTYRQPVCFTIPAAQRAGTPYVVERELDTWYEDGLCFIQAVAKERGIDTVFANMPTTTEQILHPEKYLAGEGAKPVSLTDLAPTLGAGWTRAGGGTLGEFMVQNILLTRLPADRTAVQRAAAGWGGDGWSLYVNGDSRVFQATITWDTAEDAAEFWETLQRALPGAGPALDVQAGIATWRGKLDGTTTSLLLTNDPAITLAP